MSYKVCTTSFDRVARADELLSTEFWQRNIQRKLAADALSQFSDKDRFVDLLYERLTSGNFNTEDVSAIVLIDHSKSLVRLERSAHMFAAAHFLAEALSLLKVPTEVLGFTTSSWQGGQSRHVWEVDGQPENPGRLCDVLHIVYQAFDDQQDAAFNSLSLLFDKNVLKENIDGEALEWGLGRLSGRPTERKVIFLLTDGVPGDDSTLLANGETYLWDHFRSVVERIGEMSDTCLFVIEIETAETPDFDHEDVDWPDLLIRAIERIPQDISRFLIGSVFKDAQA